MTIYLYQKKKVSQIIKTVSSDKSKLSFTLSNFKFLSNIFFLLFFLVLFHPFFLALFLVLFLSLEIDFLIPNSGISGIYYGQWKPGIEIRLCTRSFKLLSYGNKSSNSRKSRSL